MPRRAFSSSNSLFFPPRLPLPLCLLLSLPVTPRMPRHSAWYVMQTKKLLLLLLRLLLLHFHVPNQRPNDDDAGHKIIFRSVFHECHTWVEARRLHQRLLLRLYYWRGREVYGVKSSRETFAGFHLISMANGWLNATAKLKLLQLQLLPLFSLQQTTHCKAGGGVEGGTDEAVAAM